MIRKPGLDVARAGAIIWVMLFHSWGADLIGGRSPAVRDGWMGVDLFFVLSGFLICGQLLGAGANGERPSAQTFYVRRAFRILPIYSLVVAAYFLFPGIREAQTIQPAWQFWTFTENLFFPASLSSAFSHVWSLCVEEHFYLLAPLILAILSQPRARRYAPAALACLVFGGMALRAWLWMQLPARTAPHDVFIADYLRTIYYPSWARLDGLAAGAALAWTGVFHAETWRRQVTARPWLWALAGLGGLGLSVLLFADRFGFWATVAGFPVLAFSFAALVAALANPAFRLPSPIQGAVTAVALMAYSLYLVHKPVFHLVAEGAGAWCATHHLPLVVPAWAAAFLVGGAAYLAVERPFLQLRSALARARRARVRLAVTAS